jgi:LAO/AO transport system kinase
MKYAKKINIAKWHNVQQLTYFASMWQQLKKEMELGNTKSLARCISLVENEAEGYEDFLAALPIQNIPIIGITGPPGAGKSTLVDALIGELITQNKKVAVLCIDPSSPFNLGALLGDRIRLNQWYSHPNVYIRSLATRGSLGGLHPKIIEICDVLKASTFDYIIVETVGVGQSEIEIVGLADCTVVVLVPEAGDEIQTMKAGLMEIANVFVVNKADRPEADSFIHHLKQMLAPAFSNQTTEIAIVKTIASQNKGINDLLKAIEKYLQASITNQKRNYLLAAKAYHLIQKNKMKPVDKNLLLTAIEKQELNFNIYQFIKKYI